MALFAKTVHYPSLIISEEKIQVIRLDKSGKKASRLAEERLSPEVIVAGEVKDSPRLAQSLKRLFQVANITERFVVVGIPENKCFTKIIDLPKLKMDELAEAVTWEADTYLPVESEQVYMDWKIINGNDKGNIRILLIAVPREIIEGYSAALKEANLIPVAYETTALSLVRLIEREGIRALVMEIQKQHATITLSKGKEIEASSIVALSGKEDEEDLKHLTQTIEKMLTYYEKKLKDDGQVKRVYICGEAATESLRIKIAQETNREAQFVPMPIENIPKEKSQSFAIVASLAKKEIQAPKDEFTINLLPPSVQEEFDRINKKKLYKLLLAISTGVTTSVAVTSFIAFLFLKNTHASWEVKKLELGPLPPETGKVIKETQHLNRAADTIVKVSSKRQFPQKRIANVLSSLPEGVRIMLININESQKKIQISGRARTRTNLLKFRDNLEGTEAFSNAILPLSSLQQAENVDFVLTAQID